ncbi:hypothetical protein [Bradyrhizobium sp. Bra64]|uniref:hypothetical protein n=1 Tax=Bradyrhizobium sp. Bra64 TaxID=2926009 RepID=UPI0021175C50|nr:hypothetical protein [Bradyrhizobium sp. Bra64]
MSDVINLDKPSQAGGCRRSCDRTLTVFGREYSIRRSFFSSNPKSGWFSVRNAAGEIMFVRSGDLPDAMIVELIGCWIDGYGVGRKEAAKAAARGYTGDIV